MQPNRVYPQEVVNLTIDEDHGDIFAVLGHEFWIIQQRDLLKAILRADDLVDDIMGRFA